MKDQRLLIYEGIREKVYQLLAGYYLMPDADIFENLTDMQNALSNICPDAVEFVDAMRKEIPIDTLELDYTKIFLGPFKVPAPPYGSIYLDNTRTVMGPSSIDVRNRYQEFGLDLSQSFKDAPDHISAELEFIYFLIFLEIKALKEPNYENSLSFLEAQQSFLQEHLGIWVTEFAAKVIENASTDFYKNLANLTKTFVINDLKNISEVSIAALNTIGKVAYLELISENEE